MNPRHLTTWLTVFGALHRGRAGAWAWVLLGIGWTGIVWERTAGAQIRPFSEYKRDQVTLSGALSHLPLLALGVYRLERHDRKR